MVNDGKALEFSIRRVVVADVVPEPRTCKRAEVVVDPILTSPAPCTRTFSAIVPAVFLV